jgi:hypothetical protein
MKRDLLAILAKAAGGLAWGIGFAKNLIKNGSGVLHGHSTI